MCILSALALASFTALDPVKEVAGSAYMLALTESGQVYGWGNGGNGQIGKNGLEVPRPRPIDLNGRVVSVAANANTSFFVMADGTVKVLGSGNAGGFASGEEARFPRFDSHGYGTETPISIPNLKDVVQVASTQNTMAAVRRDGSVAVWGTNECGLLGFKDSHGSSFVAPAVMEMKGLPKIRAIYGTTTSFCALDTEGHLWSWGDNQSGQLGTGAGDDSFPEPRRLNIPGTVKSFALASCAGFAVTADGAVWRWGSNAWGILAAGRDEHAQLKTPTKLASVKGARKVVCGRQGRHVAVLKSDGSVITWGNSDWGQCGTGISGTSQYEIRTVKLSGVTDIWAAGNNTFFRVGTQHYWCGILIPSNRNSKVPIPLQLN